MKRRSSARGRKRERRVVMPPTLRTRSMSSNSRPRKRPCTTRLRMRPWMEDLLDRKVCQTLRWEDKEKKTFSITWRHASSHGFDQHSHGDLFSMWAHHTGKLQRGDPGEHSTNKSTFRCALHSLKDCIELTKTGEKRGEKAKRTYQFIDISHPEYDRKRKRAKSRIVKQEVKQESQESQSDFRDQASSSSNLLQTAPGLNSVSTGATALFSGEKLSVPNTTAAGSGTYARGTTSSCPSSSSSSSFSSSNTITSLPSITVLSPSSRALHSSLQTMATSQAWSGPSQIVHPDSQTPDLTDLLDQPSTSRCYTTRQMTRSAQITVPKLVYEPNAEGVISISLLTSEASEDTADATPVVALPIKQETDSPDAEGDKLPNFEALGVPDTYKTLDSKLNPKLCSGGQVRIKTIKQETLSFEEIQLPFSSTGTLNLQSQQTFDFSDLDDASLVEIHENSGTDEFVNNGDDSVNLESNYMEVEEESAHTDVPTDQSQEETDTAAAVYLEAQNTLNEDPATDIVVTESSAVVIEPVNGLENLESIFFESDLQDIFAMGYI